MNQGIKKAWVEALAVYPQGYRALRSGEKFCCLGVLCDLHSKATGTPWGEGESYLRLVSSLPADVVEWAGLDSNDPVINRIRLSDYNDGYGISTGNEQRRFVEPYDFTQIAALIQAGL